MRLLVTGGAGFIGSNFIRYIFKKHPHYQVINLDKLTYAGNPDNLRDIEKNPRYSFIKGDVCDEKLINKIMSEVDIIVHMAAASHVDRSIKDAKEFIRTNIFGTQVLLEAAKKHKIKLFVFISTDEVYGPCLRGVFKEDALLNPKSPYAASKASADLLCQAYYHTYKLPIIIVRPTNNFGYYQHGEKLIPRFITNLLLGEKVGLFGDGLYRREWLFVDDCVRAIDLILQKGKKGEIYNIGGGRKNERTNLWIAEFIMRELKAPPDSLCFIKDRPGHDRRYALDSSKITKLGWRVQKKMSNGLRETIFWYRKHPAYWQKFIKDKFVKFS